MTEEQYAEYVMALKDETPVKGYRETRRGKTRFTSSRSRASRKMTKNVRKQQKERSDGKPRLRFFCLSAPWTEIIMDGFFSVQTPRL